MPKARRRSLRQDITLPHALKKKIHSVPNLSWTHLLRNRNYEVLPEGSLIPGSSATTISSSSLLSPSSTGTPAANNLSQLDTSTASTASASAPQHNIIFIRHRLTRQIFILKCEYVVAHDDWNDRCFRELLVYRALRGQLQWRRSPHFISLIDWWKSYGGPVLQNAADPDVSSDEDDQDANIPRRNRKKLIKQCYMNFVLERADETLAKYLQEHDNCLSPFLYKSILFQLFFALYQAQTDCEFVHNDLHLNNILISRSLEAANYCYHVEHETFVPGRFTQQHDAQILIKITDFGNSRACLHDTGEIIYNASLDQHSQFNAGVDIEKIMSELRTVRVDWDMLSEEEAQVQKVLHQKLRLESSKIGARPRDLLKHEFFDSFKIADGYDKAGKPSPYMIHFGDFMQPNPLPPNDFDDLDGNRKGEYFDPNESDDDGQKKKRGRIQRKSRRGRRAQSSTWTKSGRMILNSNNTNIGTMRVFHEGTLTYRPPSVNITKLMPLDKFDKIPLQNVDLVYFEPQLDTTKQKLLNLYAILRQESMLGTTSPDTSSEYIFCLVPNTSRFVRKFDLKEHPFVGAFIFVDPSEERKIQEVYGDMPPLVQPSPFLNAASQQDTNLQPPQKGAASHHLTPSPFAASGSGMQPPRGVAPPSAVGQVPPPGVPHHHPAEAHPHHGTPPVHQDAASTHSYGNSEPHYPPSHQGSQYHHNTTPSHYSSGQGYSHAAPADHRPGSVPPPRYDSHHGAHPSEDPYYSRRGASPAHHRSGGPPPPMHHDAPPSSSSGYYDRAPPPQHHDERGGYNAGPPPDSRYTPERYSVPPPHHHEGGPPSSSGYYDRPPHPRSHAHDDRPPPPYGGRYPPDSPRGSYGHPGELKRKRSPMGYDHPPPPHHHYEADRPPYGADRYGSPPPPHHHRGEPPHKRMRPEYDYRDRPPRGPPRGGSLGPPGRDYRDHPRGGPPFHDRHGTPSRDEANPNKIPSHFIKIKEPTNSIWIGLKRYHDKFPKHSLRDCFNTLRKDFGDDTLINLLPQNDKKSPKCAFLNFTSVEKAEKAYEMIEKEKSSIYPSLRYTLPRKDARNSISSKRTVYSRHRPTTTVRRPQVEGDRNAASSSSMVPLQGGQASTDVVPETHYGSDSMVQAFKSVNMEPFRRSENRITGMKTTGFVINSQYITLGSVCLFKTGGYLLWKEKHHSLLTVDSFKILEYINPTPRIVVVGMGDEAYRLDSEIRQYYEKKLGCTFEVMSSKDAIGVWNILSGEGRDVMAFMLTKRPLNQDAMHPAKNEKLRNQILQLSEYG